MPVHVPQTPSVDTWRVRRHLPHSRPSWVTRDASYLITVCATPRGVDQLCATGTATRVIESVLFRQERGEWHVLACVVMPDHVHLLVGLPPTTDLRRLMAAFKRYLARLHHVRWQRDFFEYRLRGSDLVAVTLEYLRQNPVRAGLVRTPEDWPYFWRS